MQLGVNLDHVATLRQARYRESPQSHNVEPSLPNAVAAAERGGADSITLHLRADRRHVQDGDLGAVRAVLQTKLNLEIGNTPEIIGIALRLSPEDVCLVPENRREITTEGGLDVIGAKASLELTIHAFERTGTRVSLFIDPDESQVRAAADLGAHCVELHTGAFANSSGDKVKDQLEKLAIAAAIAADLGLKVHAGHGLNYRNVERMAEIPHLRELNIGHSIISRALYVGIENAVAEMKAVLPVIQAVRNTKAAE